MKRITIFVLLITGGVIFFASLGWYFYEQKIENPAAVSMPDNLAGLTLVDQIMGEEAAQNFINLHGKKFPLTSGAVGIYDNHEATLWIAGTPFKFMATEMIIEMQEKIAEGRSPFMPTGEISDNGRTIYSLKGMGQNHYYFQSGNLVIWLAIDADSSETALQQLKEYYP